MQATRPFPTVTGRCVCNTIRYRLLKSPLFCYACHCPDCQKQSGSAFVTFAIIETSNVSVLSDTKPIMVSRTVKPGLSMAHVECKQCATQLWGHHNAWGQAVADVRVGTLDYPSLMMPDIHSFVESKVEWVRLPEGARAAHRDFEYRDEWPKSSLKRLDECLNRFKEEAKGGQEVEGGAGTVVESKVAQVLDGEEVGGEGEKTPTGVDTEENDEEDDEAFEKRFRETERRLQERLERLSLKLNADKHKTDVDETK